MADSKIRIKLGALEVEYQGDAAFLKEDLHDLLDRVSKLQPIQPLAVETSIPTPGGAPVLALPQRTPTLQTSSAIATRLQVDDGEGVAISASAQIVMVDGNEEFTRKKLLQVMQNTTPFYKESYCKNLTYILAQLTKKDALRQTKGGMFTLSPNKRAELERAFGSAP